MNTEAADDDGTTSPPKAATGRTPVLQLVLAAGVGNSCTLREPDDDGRPRAAGLPGAPDLTPVVPVPVPVPAAAARTRGNVCPVGETCSGSRDASPLFFGVVVLRTVSSGGGALALALGALCSATEGGGRSRRSIWGLLSRATAAAQRKQQSPRSIDRLAELVLPARARQLGPVDAACFREEVRGLSGRAGSTSTTRRPALAGWRCSSSCCWTAPRAPGGGKEAAARDPGDVAAVLLLGGAARRVIVIDSSHFLRRESTDLTWRKACHIDDERWRLSRQKTERNPPKALEPICIPWARPLGSLSGIVNQQYLVKLASNVWLDEMSKEEAAGGTGEALLYHFGQPLADRLKWTLGPHSRRAQAILEDLAAYCEMQRGMDKAKQMMEAASAPLPLPPPSTDDPPSPTIAAKEGQQQAPPAITCRNHASESQWNDDLLVGDSAANLFSSARPWQVARHCGTTDRSYPFPEAGRSVAWSQTP
ncbi:hypothetical protein F5X96DRAFT_673650 [Biscogniauxia mediterranea]|nr:hypothetical protein F5X96DRAFT_673650 [Biscogniauxia mediterranea]